MNRKLISKIILFSIICIFVISMNSISVSAATRLQQTKSKTPVIIIDPGHGGDNQGTIENGYEEKQMTMITAQAMYDYLIQFENVEVYLTRTEDKEMSLKERAAFAAEKNADFLFSIHYNASEDHSLFGSEVWVPLNAPYNNYGYQFGYDYLTTMSEKGLFVRGVKTRKNDKGTDYYGILRECYSLEIPSVILEHCHVDEAKDEVFCNSTDKLIEFGVSDALAVARYFGLKSSSLGINYSSYPLVEVNSRNAVSITLKDSIAPESCILVYENDVPTSGDYTFSIIASDKHSPLMYYDYSTDGGETYSEKYGWPGSNTLTGECDKTMQLLIHYESGDTPSLMVRVYNMYDLFTVSNLYESDVPLSYGEDREMPVEEIVESSEEPEILPVVSENPLRDSVLFYVKVGALGLVSIFILWFLSIFVMRKKAKH